MKNLAGEGVDKPVSKWWITCVERWITLCGAPVYVELLYKVRRGLWITLASYPQVVNKLLTGLLWPRVVRGERRDDVRGRAGGAPKEERGERTT